MFKFRITVRNVMIRFVQVNRHLGSAGVSRPEMAWPTAGPAAPCSMMHTTETTPTDPLPNSYWVTPGRFLAGEFPGDLEDERTEARLVALLEAGLRTFIDLTEEHETDGYAPLLRCLAEERHLEVTYLRIPISDRSVAWDSTMRCILGVIDRSMAEERPVYVHCFAGIGRTGTVVGCHLRRHAQAAPGEVVTRIKELRKWMPIGAEESPHTPAQVQLVETWKEGA